MANYIASSDDYDPHVTAQWEDEDLVCITISAAVDDELTFKDMQYAWKMAKQLKKSRKEVD